MSIRGYFSEPKGVRELRSLERLLYWFILFRTCCEAPQSHLPPPQATLVLGPVSHTFQTDPCFLWPFTYMHLNAVAATHRGRGCTANFIVKVNPNINITVSCLRICARDTNRSRLTCYGGCCCIRVKISFSSVAESHSWTVWGSRRLNPNS